jgi:hypothetical protein
MNQYIDFGLYYESELCKGNCICDSKTNTILQQNKDDDERILVPSSPPLVPKNNHDFRDAELARNKVEEIENE